MKEVLEIMIKNLVDNADAVSIKELNGEKIDVILYDKDPVKFITNALSPAKDIKVTIKDEIYDELLTKI